MVRLRGCYCLSACIYQLTARALPPVHLPARSLDTIVNVFITSSRWLFFWGEGVGGVGGGSVWLESCVVVGVVSSVWDGK